MGMCGLASGQTSEQVWSALMRAALSGDQAAYHKLLNAITPHVRGVARRCLNGVTGPVDAEDIVQETLLAVHLKRSTWDPALPFTPWLNAVVRHKVIDAYRRKGGRIELEIDSVANVIAAPHDGGEVNLDVETALQSLDQRQRSIVEQISLQGRSAAEVAVALDMTEGAVRVALHRALKALAAKFSGTMS
jgi:RNA polymerase sigma factor (sigma-70 family)